MGVVETRVSAVAPEGGTPVGAAPPEDGSVLERYVTSAATSDVAMPKIEAVDAMACTASDTAASELSMTGVTTATNPAPYPMTDRGRFSQLELERISYGLDRRPVYRALKRAFDMCFSLCVVAVLLLPCLLVALVIWLDDPHGSPLFLQERVGLRGRTFRMVKFRSMYVDAEERLAELMGANEKDGPVFKIADDPRVTRVGRFIRRTSIDELPQFLNVLAGDMSVVGPRPALPCEVDQYSLRDRLRLSVKPGITCIWQTQRNRDSISFTEWVDLDLLYIQRAGLWTDLKLIVRTVGCVLTAQGE